MGFPLVDAHAVRRRRARAGAARRLARDVLRPHAGHEGRDPATPADAKGLLAAAIRDPDPVVVLEPKLVYRTARGEVPGGRARRRARRRGIAREGTDLTLVAYGAMVAVCERAAEALAGEASVEVLDLRTLKPLDEEALLASVGEDGPRRGRPGGAADLRLRRRDRGAARRAGDPRPPGAGAARDGLRRAVPLLAARGRVHAVGRAVVDAVRRVIAF